MLDCVIQLENIGKSYIIGHETKEHYVALRDIMVLKAKQIGFKTKQIFNRGHLIVGNEMEEFWALKEINFEIHQGDRLGIIGRNGAGKSTLLKVLSRITEPTIGRIKMKGRVASLLEVGTGFHPELTGRENIYLNGAILGMTQSEIRMKFDEIVDFSGVEKFLDTPVKRFSSGMYVRLAFSVAAHLETEILIIDEVLAVGDAQFQKKSLGKMEEVSCNGRTLLFVSHNMAAIRKLCNSAILLKNGTIVNNGVISDVIQSYLKEAEYESFIELKDRSDRKGNGLLKFTSLEILNSSRENTVNLCCGDDLIIRVKMHQREKNIQINKMIVSIGIDDFSGTRICHLSNETTAQTLDDLSAEINSIEIFINRVPLAPGKYLLTLFASMNGNIFDWVQNAGIISIEPGDFFRTGRMPPSGQGVLMLDHSFKVI